MATIVTIHLRDRVFTYQERGTSMMPMRVMNEIIEWLGAPTAAMGEDRSAGTGVKEVEPHLFVERSPFHVRPYYMVSRSEDGRSSHAAPMGQEHEVVGTWERVSDYRK